MYEETNALSKVLSGLSRGLGIANQVIPIYQDTKPLVKNAQDVYQIIRGKAKVNEKTNDIPKEKTDDNSPKFFI